MPRYSWKIDDLIFEEDAREIYNRATRDKEAVLISLLWITGARPAELAELKREKVYYDSGKLSLTIATKKLGEGGAFKIRERTLAFDRPGGLNTNIYIETIIKYCVALPPEALLIPYTTRWMENTVTKLSKAAIGKTLSPYHFRHSCLTWMATNGATVADLMQFKGALSAMSIGMYMHAKPFVVSLQNQRRSRSPAVANSEPPLPQPPPSSTAQTEQNKEAKAETTTEEQPRKVEVKPVDSDFVSENQ